MAYLINEAFRKRIQERLETGKNRAAALGFQTYVEPPGSGAGGAPGTGPLTAGSISGGAMGAAFGSQSGAPPVDAAMSTSGGVKPSSAPVPVQSRPGRYTYDGKPVLTTARPRMVNPKSRFTIDGDAVEPVVLPSIARPADPILGPKRGSDKITNDPYMERMASISAFIQSHSEEERQEMLRKVNVSVRPAMQHHFTLSHRECLEFIYTHGGPSALDRIKRLVRSENVAGSDDLPDEALEYIPVELVTTCSMVLHAQQDNSSVLDPAIDVRSLHRLLPPTHAGYRDRDLLLGESKQALWKICEEGLHRCI